MKEKKVFSATSEKRQEITHFSKKSNCDSGYFHQELLIGNQNNIKVSKSELQNFSGLSSHQEFLQIIYKCMLYVRKEDYRTVSDDGSLLETLKTHIYIGLNPLPKTELGSKLFSNGYFLVSYSLLMARISHSKFLFQYLLNLLAHRTVIESHLAELEDYLHRPIS